MKRLLSIVLSVVLVATMFAGTVAQKVSATDTLAETINVGDDGYRYESIFNFSADIPDTTTQNESKAYTVARVKDSENGNKWAMKITQTDSQWANDYIRFRLAEQVNIPSSDEFSFDEKLVGIRMIYRSVNSMSGNIGLFNDGSWIGRISKYDSSNYREAGSFADTLMFADSEKEVKLGGNYYFEFELHAPNANSEVEIYIYDIQFVYEVTEYRYTAAYNFDNMTTEQAQSIFVKHQYANSDVSIIEEDGKKAVEIKANEVYVYNDSYCTTDYRIDNFYIPNDEHCVGIRIQYEGINLRDGQIKFVQNYGSWGWTNSNFLTSSSTDIGKKDVAVFFADDTTLTKGEKHQLRFQLRGASGNLNVLPGIKIYKIEFLYDDVFDGVAKDLIEDPLVANGGNLDYTIPVSTLQDPNVIGMRIKANFATSGAHRIQMVYNYDWTTLVFNPYGSAYVLSQGLHDIVVMFQDDSDAINGLVAVGEHYAAYDLRDRGSWTGNATLRTQPGSNTITLEEIQLIYKEDVSSGDDDQDQPDDTPEYRYSTLYDFENMTAEQAQAIFVHHGDATSDVSIVEDNGDRAVQIMANQQSAKYGYYYTDYKIDNLGIPNDEHCVGVRIQYQGINLYDARIEFVQGGAWTGANLGTSTNVNGYNDVTLLFKDYSSLTTGNSTLRFQIRSLESSGQLPGIKIYKIEFLYDDVFDGEVVPVENYENKINNMLAYEMSDDTATDRDETDGIYKVNGMSSGIYTYTYLSGAGQNASMGLKRTTYDAAWGNTSILNITQEQLSDPSLIGMRLWINLNKECAPLIQLRYNGAWTTLQFNSANTNLSAGTHDIVVMFDKDLIALGSEATIDFSTLRYDESADYPFELCIDESGTNEIVFDNIEFIYANPTEAKFVDGTGISDMKIVHTTQGRIGAKVEFPAYSLKSTNEYEYIFDGWAQEEGKDYRVASAEHQGADIEYYAVWTPGVAALRKVVIGKLTTTSAWVENNVNADDVVDIRDLVYQKERVDELEFQAALVEMNKPGTSFLKSFGEQEEASMNDFNAAVNEEISTSKTLTTGEYIQVNFDDYTSVNTFTVNETTSNVRDFTIKAWNGEEWVRVYRNDLIEGVHECVLEQDVCTLALRLYIDKLAEGTSSATIASVTANYKGKIERTEKFGLTAFIGDSVYKHKWETIDSDILESYDDIILVNNWHFDESGNLAISVSTDEGHTRTLYSSTSNEGKEWTKTFLDNYDDLFDANVEDANKPKIWLSLTALKVEPDVTKWDDTVKNFDPMEASWWNELVGGYQYGQSDAYNSSTVRANLVNNLTSYIDYIETELGYEIYGIDFDWEYQVTEQQQKDYLALLQDLNTKFESSNNDKKISICQLTNWGTMPFLYYNDSAIDRINIMTYSHNETGTDYQHSTYLDACVNAIKGYENAGVDLSKIYLGVPFYGVETVEKNAGSTDWNKVGRYNADEFDRGVNVYTYDGVEYSFNGPNVLQDKVLYSLQQKLGGMMVWWIKNDYTESFANKDGVDYNEDLTLTYYLRDTVDRFSEVEETE